MAKCKFCNGTGKCSLCNGTGRGKGNVAHPNPSTVNKNNGEFKCPICNGTGICPGCNGKGYN